MSIDNPYWDLVKDRVDPLGSLWRTPTVDGYRSTMAPASFVEQFQTLHDAGLDRWSLVKRFSWTITDPETLAFVAEHSGGLLVDPMAGTGYWGWVLAQLGVDVVSYDAAPGTNHYHEGEPLHATVRTLDGEQAVARHSDRALLLSWPPMDATGSDILRAYAGARVIYIGESEGGCTGDEDLHELLAKGWAEVASHVPVQWNGIHDVVTVYDRAGEQQ